MDLEILSNCRKNYQMSERYGLHIYNSDNENFPYFVREWDECFTEEEIREHVKDHQMVLGIQLEDDETQDYSSEKEMFFRALLALLKEKAYCGVSFDIRSYDTAIPKEQLPWSHYFDKFINTLSVGTAQDKGEIVIEVQDADGTLHCESFTAYGAIGAYTNTEEHDILNEDWEHLFFETYYHLQSSADEPEAEEWLEQQMNKTLPCPYCDAHKAAKTLAPDLYECQNPDCGRIYNSEDIERETLRHRLSPLLSGTSEEEPLQCDIILEDHPGNCGLSTLEMLNIDKMFLFDDGTIWLHVDGTPNDEWEDFDDMDIEDIRTIVKELS